MLHALEIVRSGMPSARHAVYLNAGTWGPLPTRAADAMRARIDDVESRGRIGSARLRRVPAHPRGRARGASPSPLSSDPERIALTHSTSGGMNLVLGGLDVRAGRRDRHDRQRARGAARAARGARAPLRRRRARRRGAARARIRWTRSPRSSARARRLVALSHVLWANGRILPLREIAEAAHAAGAPVAGGRRPGRGRDRRRPGRAGRGRLRGPGPEVAVRAERRRLPVARGRLRGALRGRRAELLHARLPQRGSSRSGPARGGTTARRSPRPALAGPGGRRRVPARARGLVRGRRADGGRPRALRRAADRGPRADAAGRDRRRRAARRVHAWPATRPRTSSRRSRQTGVLARSLPGLDWVRVSLGYWVSDSDLERLAAALRSRREPSGEFTLEATRRRTRAPAA